MRSTEVTSFDQFKVEIPSPAVIDKMLTFYNYERLGSMDLSKWKVK